jgi:hypothetical protein
MYKRNSRDRAMVKQIQEALNITIDGSFGPKTEAAVIRFQSNEGLVADGIVGPKTLDVLGILDTDLKNVSSFSIFDNVKAERYYLPKGEYIQKEEPILNDYIFIHHTAGWNNPYRCIDHWGRDSRGRIATEFVLGGRNVKNGDDVYDGILLQAFPEGAQGWHLGKTGSYYMNRHSVGIELCSFGYLTNTGKTYVGTQACNSEIVTLNESFRSRNKWHRYSDAQIKTLGKWILYVASRDNIDIREGLVKWIEKMGPTKAFEFQEDAYEGKIKGLLTHTNVRKDKADCFPQPELIDMLLSL